MGDYFLLSKRPFCNSEPQNREYKFLISISIFLTFHLLGVERAGAEICLFERERHKTNTTFNISIFII